MARASNLTMCSFCGKGYKEVQKLIAGPGVYICDSCSTVVTNLLDREMGEAYRIRRTITFSPEHKQAGISILSYFAKIVEQRYPMSDVRVRLEQLGNEVTLIVETNSGDIERISQTLTDYGKVITGELAPERFLSNPVEVLGLNQKLEVSALELRLTKQLHEQYKLLQDSRVQNLEVEIRQLHKFIAAGIRSSNSMQAIIAELSKQNDKEVALKVIERLTARLAEAESDATTRTALEEEVAIMQQEQPAKFEKFKQFVNSTISSVAGNVLTPWFIALVNSFPK